MPDVGLQTVVTSSGANWFVTPISLRYASDENESKLACWSFQPNRPMRFGWKDQRSEEHTSELQSHSDLVCRLLLEKKNAEDARLPLVLHDTDTLSLLL